MEYYAIRAVVVIAICALIYIGALAMKVPIPQWLIQIIGVLIIAFVVIMGIRFLMSM